jgi:hypothetical protein
MADIPDDVRRFVLANIPSVPYLEALLLLHADPQRPLDGAALARALYLPAPRGEEILAQLIMAGLVAPEPQDPGQGRYAPADAGVAAVVDRLAEVYPRHLIPITNMIHASAGANARRFAEAFKLRKDR